ncbi:MAG: phosphatidylglycerophosphatase A [Magnetococcus sp. DMHC-1]|nr:phosphatidylglycerophosphatase A [Magnetococcales bacterium]
MTSKDLTPLPISLILPASPFGTKNADRWTTSSAHHLVRTPFTGGRKIAFKTANQYTDPLAMFLATWGGTGRILWAPGTIGILGAVPLYLLLRQHGEKSLLVGLLVLTILGIWAAHAAVRILGQAAPSEVVVDEVAGFLLAMLWVPFDWFWVVLGFVCFRLFDRVKPWPIVWLEQRLPGGWGVMADDLAAGICSAFVLKILVDLTA